MDKFIAVVLTALGMFVIVLVLAFVFAIITQWAWAGSIAQIFHLPELTFFQAFWLNMLGGMVCKSSSVSTQK